MYKAIFSFLTRIINSCFLFNRLKMKIRIVSLIVLGFLIGCKHESIITPTVPADGSGGNALNPGLVGGYLPDIGVPDPIISLSMTLDGNLKFDSSLLCNDQDASHISNITKR